MNQKILILPLLVLLFFSLNVHADAIVNPSFETLNVANDGNADGWNLVLTAPRIFSQIYDNNAQCHNDTLTDAKIMNSYGRGDISAYDGTWVWYANQASPAGHFILRNDKYIGTLTADTNIYWHEKITSNDEYSLSLGVYQQDTNRFCIITNVGSVSTGGAWQANYRTLPAGTYNGYFALDIVRNDATGTPLLYLDAFSSGSNLDINVLNGTSAYATSGDTVIFKTKVLRSDLNSFITDANVQFYSSDFNGTMAYNSSTGFYELSYAFGSKLGAYDFNVIASDTTGDLNYLNAKGYFSITFRKTSTQLSNVSNSVIQEEFQYSNTTFSGIILPSDNSNDLIYKFTGQDGNTIGVSIDFNFTIRNSDLSGKRYLVYTASQNDYDNGVWNFDSTLTFGATISTGLQRVWIDANNYYVYSFVDSSLLSNEIKYYKLKYELPFKSWNSLHSDLQSDWDISFLPSYVVSDGHYRDYFPISQFNGMRNQYKTKFPDINSTAVNDKFYLFFNAAVASGSFNELVGQHYDTNNSDGTQAVAVTTTEKTFRVPVGADYPLMKGDSATYVQLMNSDYALIERGYFLKPIELLNPDYSDIERVLIEDTNGLVINEGEPFRIESQLYNKNGDLSYLEGKVYFGSVAVNNQVAYFRQDLNSLAADEIYNLDWLVDGIIDLNGTAARDFIVVLRAVNKENDWFEIQTTTFKLRQFPNSTADLSLNAFLSNKRVGEHLTGAINLRISSPETLRGLKFYVYRVEAGINGGYSKTFWKDQDFSCNGFNCNFNFELLDQVFDGAGVWFFSVSALLTTQSEDVNNNLTTKTYSFYVNYISFDTARIFQVIERNPDFNYTTTEQIPLVLQLRDSDNANLKDRLKIQLFISDCDQNQDSATGTCNNIQDINYAPDSFLYDMASGYNYYFFKRVFIDEDGSLLNNLHFYRFTADISDIKGTHDGHTQVVLTRRCANDSYTTDFLGNALSGLNDFFNLGWNYAPDQCTLPPDKIVTVDDENELRLNIDDSISLLPPNQECVFAINADNNGTYQNGLEQDLFMGAWYSYNAAPIDKFDFYLTNDYSDISKTGGDKQYIKVSVPYELVSFNDLTLMRQSLAENYGVTANTVGELLQQGINYLYSGVGNLIVSVPEGLTASGVITNVGIDCNFSRPIDPTYIQGMIFFKLNGIKTINKQDMVILHPDLNVVDPKDLIEFMNYKNYSVPRENTTYEIYVSNMVKVMNGELNDPLVIDVPIDETKYSNEGLDQNTGFASLPERLKFYFVSELFYNHELTSNRYIVPITITAVITGKYADYFGGLGDLIDNPAKWLIQNWFLIGLLFFLILLISVIYRNFKGG